MKEQVVLLILSLLFLKHFICDWLIQTDEEIKYKGVWGDSRGLLHSVKHGIGTFIVFLTFFILLSVKFEISLERAYYLSLFDSLFHYLIDFSKQYLNRVLGLTPQNKTFWRLIGLDQFLHSLTYIWLTYLFFTVVNPI